MSVRRAKREHTYLEYLAWQRYLDDEWNRPSRADYYAMQIAAAIRNLFLPKGHRRFGIKDAVIPFRHRRRKKADWGGLSMKDRVERSKSIWMAVTNFQHYHGRQKTKQAKQWKG